MREWQGGIDNCSLSRTLILWSLPRALGWLAISEGSIHSPLFQLILQENIRPSVTQLKCKWVSWSKAVISSMQTSLQDNGWAKIQFSIFEGIGSNCRHMLSIEMYSRIWNDQFMLESLKHYWIEAICCEEVGQVPYKVTWETGHQLYSKKQLVANIANLLEKDK